MEVTSKQLLNYLDVNLDHIIVTVILNIEINNILNDTALNIESFVTSNKEMDQICHSIFKIVIVKKKNDPCDTLPLLRQLWTQG